MSSNRMVYRVGTVLAAIACILALSAAAVAYGRRGEVDATAIGGGLLMLALAVGSWSASHTRPGS